MTLPADHWARTRLRRCMIGLHMPDYDQLPAADWPRLPAILERADPRGQVRTLKRAGIEVFYFYAKCHYGNAYYPSRVPGAHVHSGLKGRDLVREYAEACQAAGLVPGVVYEFSDHRLAKDHPDWCHRNAPNPSKGIVDITDEVQGAKIAGGCLNGPYGDYALAQALEVVRGYPQLQCYYVDFLGLFGSWDAWICPYCNARFREAFGMEFPGTARLTDAQRIAYRAWRYRQYDDYTRRLKAALLAERPDLLFTHNFFGISDEPGQTRWDLAEANCDFMTKDVFSLRLGSLPIAWRARALRECSRRAPAEMLLDGMTCVGADWFTPKPADAYRAELWTARCAGVAACASFLPTLDGSVAGVVRPVLDQMGALFREQAAYEPWLRGLEPMVATAILRSRQTIENPLPDSGVKGLDHAHEFYGWCETLVASHQLWTVIQDHHLTDARLARYRVLVLPHAACLDAAQGAAIERFVHRGGRLIATGAVSMCDGEGRPRREFGLGPLLGATWKQPRQPELVYLRLDDPRLLPAAPGRQPVLRLDDGLAVVAARPGTRALGTAVRSEFLTMTTLLTPQPHPGLLTRRHGRGQVWYCAGLPGAQYYRRGQYTVRHLMAGLLERARGPRPPLRLEACGSVDLQAHTQADAPGRWVVSLVHQVSSVTRTQGPLQDGRKHDMVDAMPVLAEARLWIRPPRGQRIRKVYQVPDRRPLRVLPGGAVRIERLGVLTMLAVDFGKARAGGGGEGC